MRDVAELARGLDEIAVLLGLSGREQFKAQAFERGARVVAALGDEVTRLLAEGRLTDIGGIGPSIEKQITELWSTGSSSLLSRLRAEYPPGAAELARVPGLTLLRIRTLYEGLGITDVSALRAACEAQRVRALPRFGAKTEQRILAALERMDHERASGPRALVLGDARAIAARIEQALTDSAAATRVAVSGAARRFEETVSEVELVVTGERDAVWNSIAGTGLVVRVDRDASFAELTAGARLYVHLVGAEDFAEGLLLTTGPEPHVRALHGLAEARGLSLTHEGLPSCEACVTEADVYRTLDLAYVPPEQRHAVEALQTARNYDDLLTEGDVQGLVHCHTTYSDGKNSIEEMARAAEALGMKYITITDHSPSAHYAGGLSLDRLKQQWDEIDAVQERVGVRILRGAESDILADGSLDYPDDVIERLDVVIASIHSRFKMDRAEMTRRLIHTMQLPVFKIWGHALGRLLLQREPIDCDVPSVLDALAGSRGAIELNGDPYRLDLPPAWIPAARERGIRFVVSVDAHSTNGFGALPLAVGMARRGGLRRDEVLNTLPAERFIERVRPVAAR